MIDFCNSERNSEFACHINIEIERDLSLANEVFCRYAIS